MAERSNIEVAVRMRPILPFEDEQCWLVSAKGNSITSMVNSKIAGKYAAQRTKKNVEAELNRLNFEYDFVADEACRSEAIYRQKCAAIVQKAMKGVNGTICTYGQTCSGKTYTMLGVPQAPGLLPCALREIFKTVDSGDGWEYSVQIAYLEIYNQQLVDLLNPGASGHKLLEDSKWGIDVKSLHKAPVYSFNEAIEVLEKGQANRSYRKKDNHERSSRSHTIFRLYVESNNMELNQAKLVRRYSLLNMVDLAGSERLNDSKYDNAAQTGSINKSLFLLSNVISRLADGDSQHIPYRDSKLTRLLENSLGGNSCTLMICCVSPALVNFHETVSTLRFGQRAKKVENKKKQNYQEGEIAKLQRLLTKQQNDYVELQRRYDDLQAEMEELKHKLSDRQNKCPNVGVQSVPVVLVRYDLVCLLDEGWLEVLLKADSAYFDPGAIDKLLASKQFSALKDQLISDMQAVNREYCQQTMHYLAQNYLKSMKKAQLNLAVELAQQTYLNIGTAGTAESVRKISKLISEEKLVVLTQLEASKKLPKDIAAVLKGRCKDMKESLEEMLEARSPTRSIAIHDNYISVRAPEKSHKLCLWGSNKDGRLGHSSIDSTTVYKIPELNFKAVSLGSHHSLAITQQGEVYGWGRNACSQLGNVAEVVFVPTLISLKTKVVSVAAGWGHTLLLDSQGISYSFGYNDNGQLGQGNRQPLSKPTPITEVREVGCVYAGHSHSAVVDRQGKMYTFGCNIDCRLMISNQQDKDLLTPTKNGLLGVVQASLGVSHTCVITRQGKLFAGGDGTFGQLGIRLTESVVGAVFMSTISRKFEQDKLERHCPVVQVEYFDQRRRPVHVACGQSFTVVLDENGLVYSFGKAAYHRLGLNTLSNVYDPTQIKELTGKNIVKVTAGCRHALALTATGEVYSWGFNLYNQLGIPTQQDAKSPLLVEPIRGKRVEDIACGFFHSACLAAQPT